MITSLLMWVTMPVQKSAFSLVQLTFIQNIYACIHIACLSNYHVTCCWCQISRLVPVTAIVSSTFMNMDERQHVVTIVISRMVSFIVDYLSCELSCWLLICDQNLSIILCVIYLTLFRLCLFWYCFDFSLVNG